MGGLFWGLLIGRGKKAQLGLFLRLGAGFLREGVPQATGLSSGWFFRKGGGGLLFPSWVLSPTMFWEFLGFSGELPPAGGPTFPPPPKILILGMAEKQRGFGWEAQKNKA